jgi:hypothetical protein
MKKLFLLIGPAPRDEFPLVVVLLGAEGESLIIAVHIRDTACPVPSQVTGFSHYSCSHQRHKLVLFLVRQLESLITTVHMRDTACPVPSQATGVSHHNCLHEGHHLILFLVRQLESLITAVHIRDTACPVSSQVLGVSHHRCSHEGHRLSCSWSGYQSISSQLFTSGTPPVLFLVRILELITTLHIRDAACPDLGIGTPSVLFLVRYLESFIIAVHIRDADCPFSSPETGVSHHSCSHQVRLLSCL